MKTNCEMRWFNFASSNYIYSKPCACNCMLGVQLDKGSFRVQRMDCLRSLVCILPNDVYNRSPTDWLRTTAIDLQNAGNPSRSLALSLLRDAKKSDTVSK